MREKLKQKHVQILNYTFTVLQSGKKSKSVCQLRGYPLSHWKQSWQYTRAYEAHDSLSQAEEIPCNGSAEKIQLTVMALFEKKKYNT